MNEGINSCDSMTQGFPLPATKGIAKGQAVFAGARGVSYPPLLPAAAGGTRKNGKALFCDLSCLSIDGNNDKLLPIENNMR